MSKIIVENTHKHPRVSRISSMKSSSQEKRKEHSSYFTKAHIVVRGQGLGRKLSSFNSRGKKDKQKLNTLTHH